MMKLSTLIETLDLRHVAGPSDGEIIDVSDDSRAIADGSLFIARSGSAVDGRKYIVSAIARGARAILAEGEPSEDLSPGVTWLTAENIDQTLCSRIGEVFFDHPSRKLKLIGITGTNGKTTTAFLTQHLLGQAGVKTALLGTVYEDDGNERHVAELTTPGGIVFSRFLARAVANGCQAAVAECSSHALEQGRCAALTFHAAVFTNISGDHLDYHNTMDDYAAAKAKLFQQLPERGWAVVNIDDDMAARMLAKVAEGRVMACTLSEAAAHPIETTANTCRAEAHNFAADRTEARFDGPWGSLSVTLPMVGKHNLYNTLQAIAAAATIVSMKIDELQDALLHCPAPPGRLEPVTTHWPDVLSTSTPDALPTVLVDYAHTDGALENVLTAVSDVSAGRLIVLFGCGGDRDKTKRPRMAEVACRYGDVVVLTSDNPRTEDPATIINDALQGIPNDARDRVIVEADRALAIDKAIHAANPGDTVIIAGKGHEDYQIILDPNAPASEKRTIKIHFDDREQAAAALRKRSNVERRTSRVEGTMTVPGG